MVLKVWTTVILSECMEPTPSSHGGQTARKDLRHVLLNCHSASPAIESETVKPLLCRIPFHCPRQPTTLQRNNYWPSKAWLAFRAVQRRRLGRPLLIWKLKIRGSRLRKTKRGQAAEPDQVCRSSLGKGESVARPDLKER